MLSKGIRKNVFCDVRSRSKRRRRLLQMKTINVKPDVERYLYCLSFYLPLSPPLINHRFNSMKNEETLFYHGSTSVQRLRNRSKVLIFLPFPGDSILLTSFHHLFPLQDAPSFIHFFLENRPPSSSRLSNKQHTSRAVHLAHVFHKLYCFRRTSLKSKRRDSRDYLATCLPRKTLLFSLFESISHCVNSLRN